MKCCGEYRATAFCPDCGSKMDFDCLDGLIKFCRTHQTQIEKSIKKIEKDISELENNPDKEDRLKNRRSLLKKRNTTAAKWKTWADEVQKLKSLRK